MKNLILMLCLLSLVSTTSCDNDDDNGPDCQGINCLPPATQTGAGTFGCLVNGEPYFALGGLNAQYQLIQGEYYFMIGFDRDTGFPQSVSVIGNTELSDSETYNIGSPENTNFYGFVIFSFDEQSFDFVENSTDNINSGTLTITRLDEQDKIVSGSFEFEILNPDDGQVYQITEGRFDSFYAQ